MDLRNAEKNTITELFNIKSMQKFTSKCILKIVDWFFYFLKNATKITNLIKDSFKKIISVKTISKILHKILRIFYLHMKKNMKQH